MSFYSDPIIGDNFLSRDDILKTLVKSSVGIREGYRHNIAIIGRGLIGKTSLLLSFLNKVKESKIM